MLFRRKIMPYTILLKQMLPGLLPLFVFVIADEIWGTETGLYIAVGFGLTELLITRIKSAKWDRFIIIDTLFLVMLGAVSIILDNAVFFKLKPALPELIICLILIAAAAHPEKFFMHISARHLKGLNIRLNDKGIVAMKRMMLILTAVFAAHAALTIYAAFRMSQESWAFISGGLFYIIFAVIMAGQSFVMFIRRTMATSGQRNIS